MVGLVYVPLSYFSDVRDSLRAFYMIFKKQNLAVKIVYCF